MTIASDPARLQQIREQWEAADAALAVMQDRVKSVEPPFRQYVEGVTTDLVGIVRAAQQTIFELCDQLGVSLRRDPQGWQPIETVPMDGTHVLLWLVDEQGDGIAAVYAWFSGWCNPVTSKHLNASDEPTHWMPLPDPPGVSLRREGIERQEETKEEETDTRTGEPLPDPPGRATAPTNTKGL